MIRIQDFQKIFILLLLHWAATSANTNENTTETTQLRTTPVNSTIDMEIDLNFERDVSYIQAGNRTVEVSCPDIRSILYNVQNKLVALEDELPKHVACQIYYDCRLQSRAASNASCPSTVDGLGVCFPETLAGTVAHSNCPANLNGIEYAGNSSRECYTNGTWAIRSNYQQCTHKLNKNLNLSFCTYHEAMPNVKSYESEMCRVHFVSWMIVTIVGRSVSLFALCLAFICFCVIRRRDLKIIVHWNFVVALILRNVTWFLLFGVGFSGKTNMVECRVFATLFNYAQVVTFSWMMIEGVIIYRKLEQPFLSMADSFWRTCVCVGWGAPILIMLLWVVLKANFENEQCWIDQKPKRMDYIYQIPICVVLLMNAAIFCNFVCILSKCRRRKNIFSRPKDSSTLTSVSKAFLFYFSLLGLTYLVFMVNPMNRSTGELVFLYTNVVLESFQGFFVCLFHFFCNGQIREAVYRKIRSLRAHGKCMWLPERGERQRTRPTLGTRLSCPNSSNLESDIETSGNRATISTLRESPPREFFRFPSILEKEQLVGGKDSPKGRDLLKETTSFITSPFQSTKVKIQEI